MDIVIPNGNEKEFIEEAVKLRYKSLCFFYDKKVEGIVSSQIKVMTCSPFNSNLKTDFYLCDPKIDLREQLKRKKKLILISIEGDMHSDFLRQRNSGLNHIIVKEASLGMYFIDFRSISKNKGRRRATILGRVMQNVRLCRGKIPIGIATFSTNPKKLRRYHDLVGIGRVFGFVMGGFGDI